MSVVGDRRARGFTLLEILVALVILAVALGALIQSGSEHARNTAYLKERAQASWVGRNLLADYEAGLRAARPGEHRAEETLAGQDWEAHIRIEDVELDAPITLPTILRIDIRVQPAARADPDTPSARVTGYALP
ncbi:MAG: type II secretion system minor pseudopilin GspI [Pseudomonadota bacterium]